MQGMDRYECRKKVVEDTAGGWACMEKIEEL